MLCSWCGPCRAIAPVFSDLATKNADVTFVKIDVDDNTATAEEVCVGQSISDRSIHLLITLSDWQRPPPVTTTTTHYHHTEYYYCYYC